MPLELGVWRIDEKLTRVAPSKLDEESRLEDFIDADIGLVRDDLWVVGRQVPTAFGHYIDLLALDAQGNVTILELKRDKTPREVVAQTLDYGSWVGGLSREDLARIHAEYVRKYHPDRSEMPFEASFGERFGVALPETINESHELLVVAAALDESTERIIDYLINYGVPINAVFFRVFKDATREYLTRAWLRDPSETHAKTEEAQARQKGKEPWNGNDFYVSFGQDAQRDWEDAREYGFVSAGGGAWFTRTMRQLKPGHRIFVCVPKKGYVGVGLVTEPATRADNFEIRRPDGTWARLSTMPLRAKEMFHPGGDFEVENVVRVEWEKTLPLDEAIWETGLFANQNSACKLRSRFTIERLTERFNLTDQMSTNSSRGGNSK